MEFSLVLSISIEMMDDMMSGNILMLKEISYKHSSFKRLIKIKSLSNSTLEVTNMPNFYSGHEMILNRINVFVFCRYYLEAIGYVFIPTDCIIKKISYFLQIYNMIIENFLVIHHLS